MDRNLKKTRKRQSPKKKDPPLKVVYISNPMRVYTSASEFRALVQELTGKDAEFPDSDRFPGVYGEGAVSGGGKKVEGDEGEVVVGDAPAMEDSGEVRSEYESFEDLFTVQMMENLAGFLPPAMLYGADHLV